MEVVVVAVVAVSFDLSRGYRETPARGRFKLAATVPSTNTLIESNGLAELGAKQPAGRPTGRPQARGRLKRVSS